MKSAISSMLRLTFFLVDKIKVSVTKDSYRWSVSDYVKEHR